MYAPLLNVPSAPLCITVGGLSEKEAMESMEAWREVVGGGRVSVHDEEDQCVIGEGEGEGVAVRVGWMGLGGV
jgi:hypothetical protein